MAFEAVCDALASGTFLYVGAIDVIEEVFAEPSERWLKNLLIVSGFMLTALVAV